MCAISTNSSAPTPWAMAAIRSKSQVREYAEAPATTTLGRTSAACAASAS
jgi:hypothetical protein